MRIPPRILGLIVATIAAPVIAGCAGEVADTDGEKREDNLPTQEPPREEPSQPSSAAPPTAPTENAQSAAPPPQSEPPKPSEQPEEPEDPCPPCGMG